MSAFDWLPAGLRQQATARQLVAGESLFHQGDRAVAIFEVVQGRVQLIRHAIDGRRVVLHTARPGELFAEAALFADSYHCDAVATVAARVGVYPKRALRAAFRKDPALAERFMAVLARQIHGLRNRLEERNIRSARARVLNRLALAAEPRTRAVQLDGTLMDLAAEIGLTHEALYRTLAALEKDGVIVRSGMRIVLARLPKA
ncbi:MAG: Crp/Fnr family transcriptional regulator [Reyranellales bacterium]